VSDAPEGYPPHIAHVNGLKLPAYEYREYPKVVRHPDGAEKTCQSREEEEHFLSIWEDQPEE